MAAAVLFHTDLLSSAVIAPQVAPACFTLNEGEGGVLEIAEWWQEVQKEDASR